MMPVAAAGILGAGGGAALTATATLGLILVALFSTGLGVAAWALWRTRGPVPPDPQT